MSTDSWSTYILTFVTFAPLVGALLLVLFPRRDRDIRIFALVVSLLTFVLVAASCRYTSIARSAGFQYEIDRQWISTPTFTTTWPSTASLCGWWC